MLIIRISYWHKFILYSMDNHAVSIWYTTMKLITSLITLLVIASCTQSNYMSSTKVSKGTSVVVIMPEQKCAIKDNGRDLIDEKILHPAHKECYYK